MKFYGNAGSVKLETEDCQAAFIIANPKDSGVTIVPHRFTYNNFSKEQMSVAYYFYARPAGKFSRSESIIPFNIHKEKMQLEKCRLYQGKNITILAGDKGREVMIPGGATTKEEMDGELCLEEGSYVVIVVKPLMKAKSSVQIGFEASWSEIKK